MINDALKEKICAIHSDPRSFGFSIPPEMCKDSSEQSFRPAETRFSDAAQSPTSMVWRTDGRHKSKEDL
jgi:hypothetical protein